MRFDTEKVSEVGQHVSRVSRKATCIVGPSIVNSNSTLSAQTAKDHKVMQKITLKKEIQRPMKRQRRKNFRSCLKNFRKKKTRKEERKSERRSKKLKKEQALANVHKRPVSDNYKPRKIKSRGSLRRTSKLSQSGKNPSSKQGRRSRRIHRTG